MHEISWNGSALYIHFATKVASSAMFVASAESTQADKVHCSLYGIAASGTGTVVRRACKKLQ